MSSLSVRFNDEWLDAREERTVATGTWVAFEDGSKTLVPVEEVPYRIKTLSGKRVLDDSRDAKMKTKKGRQPQQKQPQQATTTNPKKSKKQATTKGGGGGGGGGSLSWSAREPRLAEVKHLVHFLLAQLRWQHGKLVGSFEEFDEEAAQHNHCIDGEEGTVDNGDIAAMSSLMDEFFSRHARGDKWVPFFAVLGEHELYLMRRIWALKGLDTRQRYALSCGFSGSRWAPLFEEAVLCCFESNEVDSPELSAEAKLMFENPAEAFRRGGAVHKRFDAYRAKGGKLHTTCFSPRPVPSGASGKEYTFYILERTRTFFTMGLDIFDRLTPLKSSGGWESIDLAMQETKWVGPTVSKMFLVSTHFGLPNLHLLDEGIEVGIGAQEAFKILHPGIQPAKNYDMLPDRREILISLFQHVRTLVSEPASSKWSSSSSSSSSAATSSSLSSASSHSSPSLAPVSNIEPRLLPMIKWCSERARQKYKGVIPTECFEDYMSVLNFQVNLCEWRKFRNNVDKRRQGGRGMHDD